MQSVTHHVCDFCEVQVTLHQNIQEKSTSIVEIYKVKISFFRFLNKAYDPGVEHILANKSNTQQNFSGNWQLQRGSKRNTATHAQMRVCAWRGEGRRPSLPPLHCTVAWPAHHLQPRGPAVA